MRKFRIQVGKLIRKLGKGITPHYWRCCACGHTEWKEEEVLCWKCGTGEMIYKG